MHKVLFFVILVLFALTSCTNEYKDLVSASKSAESLPNLLFHDTTEQLIYDTGIRYKDNYTSGLMVVRYMDNEEIRVAFTTKMGLTLFDFTILKDEMIVNQCVDQLNKRMIKKLLERDLRLVFQKSNDSNQHVNLKDPQKNQQIIRTQKDKVYTHYYYEDQQVTKCTTGSDKKPKTIATVSNYANGIPNNIKITHSSFSLVLDLKYYPAL